MGTKKGNGVFLPRPCQKCGRLVLEARNEQLATMWVEQVPIGEGGLSLQAAIMGPPLAVATSTPSSFKPHLCSRFRIEVAL